MARGLHIDKGMMKPDIEQIIEVFKGQGINALYGKGGFWLKGQGFISLAKARQLTGIKGTARKPKMVISAFGDWAWVAKINRIKL